MNIFEQATKQKLRFGTVKGMLTSEALWDIPLSSKTGAVNLDGLWKGLRKEIKDNDEDSFVAKRNSGDSITQLRLEIVEHIFNVRLAEIDKRRESVAIKEELAKLHGVKTRREDADLEALSQKDLDERIKKLQEA